MPMTFAECKLMLLRDSQSSPFPVFGSSISGFHCREFARLLIEISQVVDIRRFQIDFVTVRVEILRKFPHGFFSISFVTRWFCNAEIKESLLYFLPTFKFLKIQKYKEMKINFMFSIHLNVWLEYVCLHIVTFMIDSDLNFFNFYSLSIFLILSRSSSCLLGSSDG